MEHNPDNNNNLPDMTLNDNNSADITEDMTATIESPGPKDSDRKRKRSKKSKKHGRRSLIVGLLALVAMISIFCNIFLVIRYKIRIEMIDGKPTILSENQFNAIKRQAESQVTDEITDRVTEDIRQTIMNRLAAGDSATYLLRTYYPEYIVYMDEGIYKFSKIKTDLKLNKLEKSNFNVAENGEITYSENGTVTSVKGIDVSKYQGNIDFAKVKAAGVDYAMLRCGYRGYGNGTLVEDDNFKTYATNATANGVDIGVYFFSQAVSKEEAVEEANYVLELIKPYNVTYPIAIDIEEVANATARQDNLNAKELTDVIIAFCDTIKSAGYTPMIYSNIRYFAGKVEYERLEAYDKWFASYSTQLYFPYEISMWQYTNTGSIDGIKGDVDINISFKKFK